MLVALLFPLNLKWAEGKGVLGSKAFVCLFGISDLIPHRRLAASCLSGASGSGNPGVCIG